MASWRSTHETAQSFMRKLDAFENEVHPGKSLHLTLVSANGAARNAYCDVAQRIAAADGPFA